VHMYAWVSGYVHLWGGDLWFLWFTLRPTDVFSNMDKMVGSYQCQQMADLIRRLKG
jgi:hypothetical protein